MTPTEVYEAYVTAENARDDAAMARWLAPDLTVTVNGVAQLADRDGDAEATDRLRQMYPTYRRLLHHIFEVGNTVVAEWEMTAPADPARQLPALAVVGCSVAEVVDDVITSARLYADPAALERVLSSTERSGTEPDSVADADD